MKVATLTWYSGNNYGTTMQAYALQKVLLDMGHYSEIIDYSPRFIYRWKMKIKNHSVKETIDYKINETYLKHRKEGKAVTNDSLFDQFRKEHLHFSKPCHTINQLSELGKDYDAIICGSDQIWNPYYYDPVYFLTFVAEKEKRIAYAPSFGISDIPDFAIHSYKKSLSMIDKISVREQQGAEIIKRLTNRIVNVVADPSFLLSREEWQSLGNSSKIVIDKPYILTYFLRKNTAYYDIVYQIAKKNNLSVVNIPMVTGDFDRCDTIIEPIGPKEWISLIDHSNIVITDSFHCTAFSIIMKKQFGTFLAFSSENVKSQNSRIESLLTITGLKQCVLSDNAKDICHLDESDIICSQKKLRSYVEYSKEWLEKALIK